MRPLSGIFSLLVAAAGWYYMFYSRAAQKLGGVEAQAVNLQRVRLRRVGGFVMFLLAVAMFAGVWSIDWQASRSAFVAVWFTVFILLGTIVVLALLDLRLTAKLRRRRAPTPTDLTPPPTGGTGGNA